MFIVSDGLLIQNFEKNVVENIGEKVEKYPAILNENNMLLGHIVFHPYFGEHTYEIGGVFHSSYYNSGFASEVAKAVLQYKFEELKLHCTIATCQPENIGSYRVMQKYEMSREGYVKNVSLTEKAGLDEYYYTILAEEWEVG